jgi:hypothetical protein
MNTVHHQTFTAAPRHGLRLTSPEYHSLRSVENEGSATLPLGRGGKRRLDALKSVLNGVRQIVKPSDFCFYGR